MSDNETAAFAVLMVFGVPTFGWIVVRLLRHRERMEMIRHGLLPPDSEQQWQVFAARAQASPPCIPQPSPWDPGAQASLRKGIVTTAIGVALLIGLSFIGYRPDGSFTLGPWLLGGLIPLFVGLAQIANAMLSGAQFPRSGAQAGPVPPPHAPPSGPYAYRPGSAEELPRTNPPQSQ